MCHLRPQAGDRYREHALAERHRLLSVVENDAEFEILAAGRGQLSKPLEIAGSDGRSRFDLNTNYISTLSFHDDVHFVLILISVVVKSARLAQSIHLFHNLRESESLKQRAKDRSILTDSFLDGTQDRGQQIFASRGSRSLHAIGNFVGCTSLDTEMPPGGVQLRLVLPFPDSRR
jgi:hypothetical protein